MSVQLPPPDDGHDDRRTPPKTSSAESPATGQCSIRMASDGTSAVEIVRAGAEPPLLLGLPALVSAIVSCEIESRRRMLDPAHELARKYREWENCTSPEVKLWGKGATTCFENSCGVPDLLFWTLEHFSDRGFPLTESQKTDLTFHTFQEADSVRGCHVGNLMGTDTTDALEYCWYFLVRLLAVEADLATGDSAQTSIDQHRELIRSHYSLLLQDLTHFHELGWITTASPRVDLEAKLIDLAISYPRVKPVVAAIVRDWDALEEAADRLHELAESRSDRIGWHLGREREAAADDALGDDMLGSVFKQARVMRQIRCLEQLMTPKSEDDPVWHYPLEYIEQRAERRHVLFVNPSIDSFRGDDFSNGQKLEFMLLERMAHRGFRHWLYPEPQTHLHYMHKWLKNEGDSRSLKELTELLKQFLTLPADRARPSLRHFLALPETLPPSPADQEIRYWEKVCRLQKRSASEVRLYMADNFNERTAALEWMRASDDKKFVVIGDGGAFQGSSFFHGCTTRDMSLLVHHIPAVPSYECSWDYFRLPAALRYAAFEVGRKKGWGFLQSAALPVKDNRRFLNAFASGEMQDASNALYAYFHVTTSGGYIDAALFTAEEDLEEDDATFESREVDANMPPSETRV